jgi:hypothetical protein
MLMAAGKWGSILALIALLVVALKQLIVLIGIIGFAIKALLVLAFLALFVGVGFMIYRSWANNRKQEQSL